MCQRIVDAGARDGITGRRDVLMVDGKQTIYIIHVKT